MKMDLKNAMDKNRLGLRLVEREVTEEQYHIHPNLKKKFEEIVGTEFSTLYDAHGR